MSNYLNELKSLKTKLCARPRSPVYSEPSLYDYTLFPGAEVVLDIAIFLSAV